MAEVNEEKEYTVYIWIEETNLDQNIMMGQTFNTVIRATGEMYYTSSEEDFDIDENGVITLYKGEGGNVIIPETINDVAVTAIGPVAFSNVIPDFDTLQPVGFKDMNPVTSVVIPEGVTTI